MPLRNDFTSGIPEPAALVLTNMQSMFAISTKAMVKPRFTKYPYQIPLDLLVSKYLSIRSWD